MNQPTLKFRGENSPRFIKVMKKVIHQAEHYKDQIAKETAEAVLEEYKSTGEIVLIAGLNDALYELIMNYGGLFDGKFAQRIVKGDFVVLPEQKPVAIGIDYKQHREHYARNNSLKGLIEKLRTITDKGFVGG